LKNILKLFQEIFKGIGKKEISDTRIAPSNNQYDSYFDKILLKNNLLAKLKTDKNLLVIGSCFSLRVSDFINRNFKTKIYEENRLNLKVNWGRVYSIKNIEQIIQYSVSKKKIIIEKNKSTFFDPLREDTISIHDNREKLKISILNHRMQSLKAFKNASTIILILGINEIWYDKLYKCYWGTKPSSFIISNNPNRFVFKKITYKEMYLSLINSIKLLKKINPSVKIVLSLGVVPPEATYLGQSILENFFLSQGEIRNVVNKIIIKKHKNITYFPLFEYLFFRNPLIFKADNRHINEFYVKKSLNLLFRK